MAAKKATSSDNNLRVTIDIPQDIHDVGFFKRLPYKLTKEQWNFIDSVWDQKNIGIFCNAKAGTSKTTLAVGMAMLMAYEFKMYRNIYYIISPCEEDKLGFAPGTIEEKTAMYMEPLRQALLTWGYDPNNVIATADNMDAIKNGTAIIRAIPHTFLRGYDLSNSFIICEEAQNYRLLDLKKTLTRAHDDCKVLVVGSSIQCDLKYKQDSGFTTYTQEAFKQEFCDVVELTENHRGKFSSWCDSITQQ